MKQISKKKRKEIKAEMVKMNELFPRCFFVGRFNKIPLKTGIRDDLLARFADDEYFTEKRIGKILAYYTKCLTYLECFEKSDHRVDLNGGISELSAKDKEYAKELVEKREKMQEKRQEKNRVWQTSPAGRLIAEEKRLNILSGKRGKRVAPKKTQEELAAALKQAKAKTESKPVTEKKVVKIAPKITTKKRRVKVPATREIIAYNQKTKEARTFAGETEEIAAQIQREIKNPDGWHYLERNSDGVLVALKNGVA